MKLTLLPCFSSFPYPRCNACQTRSKQQERGRFRNCRCLRSARNLPGQRNGLPRVNRDIVDAETERAMPAGCLTSRRRLRFRVGLAVRIVEGEDPRCVVYIHEDAACIITSDSARDSGAERRLIGTVDALRGGECHLQGENGIVRLRRSAQADRAQVIEVRARIRISANRTKAIGCGAREGGIGVSHTAAGCACSGGAAHAEAAIGKACDVNFIRARNALTESQDGDHSNA